MTKDSLTDKHKNNRHDERYEHRTIADFLTGGFRQSIGHRDVQRQRPDNVESDKNRDEREGEDLEHLPHHRRDHMRLDEIFLADFLEIFCRDRANPLHDLLFRKVLDPVHRLDSVMGGEGRIALHVHCATAEIKLLGSRHLGGGRALLRHRFENLLDSVDRLLALRWTARDVSPDITSLKTFHTQRRDGVSEALLFA